MKSKTARFAALAALVTAIGVTVAFLPQVKEFLLNFLRKVEELGLLGAVLLGVVYVISCVLFVPGWILSVGAGYLYKLFFGTVLISIASTTGATAAFLMGRTLLRGWVQHKVEASPKFLALDEAVARQGFKIVLLTRLSPAFPFNLLNYFYGITKVRLRDYVLASWIGMLPGTVMYVYFGAALNSFAELASGKFGNQVVKNLLFALGLVATIAVTMLITRMARKALREAIPAAQHEPSGTMRGKANV